MNPSLEPERIAQLENALRARQDALLAEIRRDVVQADGDQERMLGDGVRDSGDDSVVDLILAVESAETSRGLGELRAVEAALRDIDHGTYGLCDACGNVIGYARLRAHPTARRCIACQTRYERTHAQSTGPTL